MMKQGKTLISNLQRPRVYFGPSDDHPAASLLPSAPSSSLFPSLSQSFSLLTFREGSEVLEASVAIVGLSFSYPPLLSFPLSFSFAPSSLAFRIEHLNCID